MSSQRISCPDGPTSEVYSAYREEHTSHRKPPRDQEISTSQPSLEASKHAYVLSREPGPPPGPAGPRVHRRTEDSPAGASWVQGGFHPGQCRSHPQNRGDSPHHLRRPASAAIRDQTEPANQRERPPPDTASVETHSQAHAVDTECCPRTWNTARGAHSLAWC